MAPVLNRYLALRGDVRFEDVCIAYFGSLLIPHSLRKSCMVALHVGHSGMSKMHLRAKQSLYWPGISQEIRNKVVASSQQKELAIHIETPLRPWQNIGMDLFCKENVSNSL